MVLRPTDPEFSLIARAAPQEMARLAGYALRETETQRKPSRRDALLLSLSMAKLS